MFVAIVCAVFAVFIFAEIWAFFIKPIKSAIKEKKSAENLPAEGAPEEEAAENEQK